MHGYSLVSSVQFSSVVSDSAAPWGAAPSCPSPTPGAYSNPCPSSRWCHPAISSSVSPFSSCPQSFPASESFQMSQFRIRWPKYWNFSFSISPSSEYSGLISFKIDWFDLLAVQGTLKSLSNSVVHVHNTSQITKGKTKVESRFSKVMRTAVSVLKGSNS